MLIVVDQKNSFAAAAYRPLGEVQVLPTSAITRQVLSRADAVIVRSETIVDASLLEGTAVRFVGTATIGTDHVDEQYLASHGIAFVSAPGSNAESVAQYLAAGLLLIADRLGLSLSGRTLGVVGVGNVGSRVCRVAEGLGLTVLKNDPPLARATGDPSYRPLDALMEADFITLHVPLTSSGPDPTYHLFDGDRLRSMKQGAILINTSRGAVVEGGALLQMLRGGLLAGALLDTWEGEPAIDTGLLGATTIGTPHIAGYSLDGKVNAARMVFEGACRHFGLSHRWEFREHLPAPRVEMIDVAALPAEAEEALRSAVAACYDIASDDAALRKILGMQEQERARHFRELRSSYPARREFSATRLQSAGTRPDLAARLRSLGFTSDGMQGRF